MGRGYKGQGEMNRIGGKVLSRSGREMEQPLPI
jgi:hypothetical protein